MKLINILLFQSILINIFLIAYIGYNKTYLLTHGENGRFSKLQCTSQIVEIRAGFNDLKQKTRALADEIIRAMENETPSSETKEIQKKIEDVAITGLLFKARLDESGLLRDDEIKKIYSDALKVAEEVIIIKKQVQQQMINGKNDVRTQAVLSVIKDVEHIIEIMDLALQIQELEREC